MFCLSIESLCMAYLELKCVVWQCYFFLILVELKVEGSGCQNELSVYQNSAASRPYFILATYSKYGSINGGFRHVNCTEDQNEVLSVLPAAGLGTQTLAYIPSEKSSDSIRYELYYSIHKNL